MVIAFCIFIGGLIICAIFIPLCMKSPFNLFTPVNRKTGKRLTLYTEDKIPRGRGWKKVVTDIEGKEWKAWGKSCGLPKCFCDAYVTDKVSTPKLRKGQKCWGCKKEIKGEWCYNGHYWHEKCMDKETNNRINDYLKSHDR